MDKPGTAGDGVKSLASWENSHSTSHYQIYAIARIFPLLPTSTGVHHHNTDTYPVRNICNTCCAAIQHERRLLQH